MFKPFSHTRVKPSASSLARALRKLSYYALSIPRLLIGIKRPWRTVRLFLGLGSFPVQIELRANGLRLDVRDKMDIWVAKETCLDDSYLPHWLRAAPDWRVIDIGGGVGDFAVMMALRCPKGVVHVYEPSAEAFALVEENVRTNEVGNVVAHRSAVADEACEMSAENETRGVETRFTKDGPGTFKARAISLVSALDGLPDGECDFLKIDCEGGEFDLLLASDPELLQRIHRISLEFHDGFTRHTGRDIAEHLETHGFRVWERANPVHAHLGQLYAERIVASAKRAERVP